MAYEKIAARRFWGGAVFLIALLPSYAVLVATVHALIASVPLMNSPGKLSSVHRVKHNSVISNSPCPRDGPMPCLLGTAPLPSENAPFLPRNIDEIVAPEGSIQGIPHLQMSLHKDMWMLVAVLPRILALERIMHWVPPTPPPVIPTEKTPLWTASPPIKAFAPAEHSKNGSVLSSASLPPTIPNDGTNHKRPPNTHIAVPSDSMLIPPVIALKAPPKFTGPQHASPLISSVAPSIDVLVPSPYASVPKNFRGVHGSPHISPAPSPPRVVSDRSDPPEIHPKGSVAPPSLISPSYQKNQYEGPTSVPPTAFSEHLRPPGIHRIGRSPGHLGVTSAPPSLSSVPTASSRTNGPSSAPSTSLPSQPPVVTPSPTRTFQFRHGSIAPSTSKVRKNRIGKHVSASPTYSLSPRHEKGPCMPPHPSHAPLDRAPAPRSVQPPVWQWHKQHAAPPESRGIYSHPPDRSKTPSTETPIASSGLPYPPEVFPSSPPYVKPKKPVTPFPARMLPPPPPNRDCEQLACAEPYTNTLPGSPCGCVLPIQVGLRLSVPLYTFFPLVSEFALEVSSGIKMNVSQVRIMGANADNQQQDKTIVNIDLVPTTRSFNFYVAFSVYQMFWNKMVAINVAFFGDYEVLYVRYPGLPPSPPWALSGPTINGLPSFPGNGPQIFKPIGVDVSKHKLKLGGSSIAIIALSSVLLVLCTGVLSFFIFRHSSRRRSPHSLQRDVASTLAKPPGTGSAISDNGSSSASLSFASSIGTYTRSAKTFTLSEMRRATNNFDPARILGEGGFGRVYSGVLEDGKKVAVKVLKRDDQQGGREFLAEIEMLSRLHHRNLVKLIGICTKERMRCLVYELVPNGSVDSHLHGVDKETSPLDWDIRAKIALGAARGLAYLHEDSKPRVIHRDFKSSNILLEDDFTPKVSDFGLARAAVEEGNEHVSTRVMGTFGYVAPEYAMTGHLLVKSDVYSYGVVLLELLTGRKPVDMSQPQGQENLVTWARPLLTSKEGLQMIIDPVLSGGYLFDSLAKVAAIAAMCVQPEVSDRPFMGEVVQALKLVCNETYEKDGESGSCSQEQLSLHDEFHTSFGGLTLTDQAVSFSAGAYDHNLVSRWPLSVSGLLSNSERFHQQTFTSLRWNSSSGPLRTNSKQPFWQRLRELSRGTASEHGIRSWPGV